MSTMWIRELRGGLDSRRMPETSPGGVLIEATDGHITRGGEFEQRAAFVPAYTLPAGTVGMSKTRASLVVFGSDPAPAMPVGVAYQRLQHPSGVALATVLSEDIYAGRLYVVGQFADGSVHHFYDGQRVEDWFDGRARASFRVVDGRVNPATRATARIEVTSGTSGSGNTITNVRVNSVIITSSAVAHTGNNVTTAEALAASINAASSSPNYTAEVTGQIVTIRPVTAGAGSNGLVVAATVSGNVVVTVLQNMQGGTDPAPSRLETLTVDGVAAIQFPVDWSTSNTVMAAAIASAVNSFVSNPDYIATATGDTVNIIASTPGPTPNGRAVNFTVSNGLSIAPTSGVLAGGVDSPSGFTPGTFVRTVGSKMYSTSGPNLHFSGVQEPTKWQTGTTGAGFIDMSTQSSGAERLVALAEYQDRIAIFAEEAIIIFYVDPDPDLNKRLQTLNNTGTESPRSVTQFGDADIFYLDESGLRSIRARDTSNAAATEDIGVPVDTLVTEALRGLTDAERQQVTGAIEPRDGRFWLSMKDQIFVFSYFPGSETSAWSVYRPSWGGVPLPVESMVSHNRKMFIRSGNMIYAYGGLGTDLVHDDTVAIARLPYLNGETPTRKKSIKAVDGAVEGQWDLFVGMDPNNLETVDKVAVMNDTTFDTGVVGALGQHTHISLLMKSRGVGPHKIGSLVIHFEGSSDED